MSLRINTNQSVLVAKRNLDKQQKRFEHAQAALASGKRIVNSSDDAAGLAIAENLKGQISGVRMAAANANNAQSLMNISEGALNEISNILIRLRELGVQAASDTVGDTEREFMDEEVQQLISEADRITQSTRFGENKLLDGSGKEMEFHVGPFAGKENVIRFNFNADARTETLGIEGISVADKGEAKDSLENIDDALIDLNKIRASYGAIHSRLESTINNLSQTEESLSSARSKIADADIAKETAELTQANILQQAAVSVLASANQSNSSALRLLV